MRYLCNNLYVFCARICTEWLYLSINLPVTYSANRLVFFFVLVDHFVQQVKFRRLIYWKVFVFSFLGESVGPQHRTANNIMCLCAIKPPLQTYTVFWYYNHINRYTSPCIYRWQKNGRKWYGIRNAYKLKYIQ